MANSNGWGDGSVNNNIAWGQGANNTIGWGKSHIDSWAGATDIDGGNLPSNSVAPALSGTAQEGQTLTCSTGTWSGSPTYTYQWKRNGNNITSATNSTYTLVIADVGQSIKCTVTATNFIGSATADSNTVTPASAFTGLLDTYIGASAAYSLRRLSTAYTGNLIRVRRSSDNTEQDIGYNSSNVLDETALTSFVGAGNGFITTWYDQSGNGYNTVQTTAANQPRIVNSGTVDKENSKPCAVFDGSNDFVATTGTPFSATSNTLIAVSKQSALGSYKRLFNIGNFAAGRYLGSDNNTNDMLAIFNNSTFTCSGGVSLSQNVSIMYNSGTSGVLRNNGLQVNTVTASAASYLSKNLFIGNDEQSNVGYFWNGTGQEFIFYPSSQGTNASGIETNINTFYSIY